MGTPAGKTPPDITLIALVSAVGTALAAFQLFQPKFAIGLAMRRETGRVEPGFQIFYIAAQYLSLFIVGTIIIVLLLAFANQLDPDLGLNFSWLRQVTNYLTPEHLIIVLLMGACLAATIQLNVMSWIFLTIGRFLSLLPVPALNGAFGRDGRSAGWHQANCICVTWDKGQPLLISEDNIKRVADVLLFKLASSNPIANFAAKPALMSSAAAANMALIGSVIENAHGLNRWKRPSNWTIFFRALEDIHAAEGVFEPKAIVAAKSSIEQADRLRVLLATRMQQLNETVPADNYFAAGSILAQTYALLKAGGGSILGMMPSYAGFLGSRTYWLNRTLDSFPTIDDDSLRPQIIKLIGRWNLATWIKAGTFHPPFSSAQGWLLLQESALTVFSEQKEVTFWAVGDKAITREACRRIYLHLHQSVEDGLTKEAQQVRKTYPTDWDLLAAADFALWSHATDEKTRGDQDDWQAKAGWRWKLINGRALKIS